MKKNKLYTVNRWNQPAFMPQEKNLFSGLFGSSQMNQPFKFAGFTPGAQAAIDKNIAASLPKAGGLLGNIGDKLKGVLGGGNQAGSPMGGIISAAGNLVGGLGNSIISGGLSSGAGSAVSGIGSTVGGLVSSVNPVLGGIISAGSGILGGGINALFGESVDEEALKAANAGTDAYNNFTSNAGSFDDITGPEVQANVKDVYRGGLFNDVSDKNEALKKERANARSWAFRSVDNNIYNLVNDQKNDYLANYAASGGQLESAFLDSFSTDPIGAAVRYNQGLERMAAEKEAAEAEAAREAEYNDMLTRIASLETQNQGLQSMMGALSVPQIISTPEASPAPSTAADDFNNLKASLKQSEGFSRKAVTLGGEAHPTIGYGFYNIYPGTTRRVQAGDTITEEEADKYLDTAIRERADELSRKVPNWDKLNAGQRDALIDLAFNAGSNAPHFRKNSKLMKALENEDWELAAENLATTSRNPAFNKGMQNRSNRRRNMFMGDYGLKAFGGLTSSKKNKFDIGGFRTSGLIGDLNLSMELPSPEEQYQMYGRGLLMPGESNVMGGKGPDTFTWANGGKLFGIGGDIQTHGADFTNGLLYIDEGGSHEDNPLDGVPMGLDPEGIPNLVEEGETVYNNYVFSDRLNVPDFMYKELGLGGVMRKNGKGMSFADASKKLAEESEQRPNDPISQAGLDASLSKLAEVQEAERMKRQAEEYTGLQEYSCGGGMKNKYKKGGNKLTNLNTYGYDPIETFKYWNKDDNDYDEGYRDFIENKLDDAWINRVMQGSEGDMSRYKGSNNVNPTIDQAIVLGLDRKNSDWHKAMAKAYDEYLAGINPVTGEASVASALPASSPSPSDADIPEAAWMYGDRESMGLDANYGKGFVDDMSKPASEGVDKPVEDNYDPYPTWMRYAPVVGSGIMSLTDALGLTNRPDYTSANALEAAARQAGYAPSIGYRPIGNYLTYRPLDIWFAQNRMDANSRATDRNLMNISGGNRGTAMAGLLANGYANQVANGNLFRQAMESNIAQRQQVEDFNRRTNMFNSQMGLEAAMANARYRQAARQMGLSGLAQAAALRDSIDARTGAARSANITNFLTSLGNIGRENFALNQINSDRSRQYGVYSNGTSEHKRSSKGKKGSRWS